MPRTASAASSPAHSPRPAPEAAAHSGGPLQRPRSWCCDRNAATAPLPIRRRRGRTGRDTRDQPADSLVTLRGIAAATTLRRLVPGWGASANGEQRSRRLCATSRRRWIAGSPGGLSCARWASRVPRGRRSPAEGCHASATTARRSSVPVGPLSGPSYRVSLRFTGFTHYSVDAPLASTPRHLNKRLFAHRERPDAPYGSAERPIANAERPVSHPGRPIATAGRPISSTERPIRTLNAP